MSVFPCNGWKKEFHRESSLCKHTSEQHKDGFSKGSKESGPTTDFTDAGTIKSRHDENDPEHYACDDTVSGKPSKQKPFLTINATETQANNEPPVWFETYVPRPKHVPNVRKTLKRNNKLSQTPYLPAISAPNLRSLGPKIRNFTLDFKMRGLGLALCSETWGKDDKKAYQSKIKRMLEIEGISTISTNRKYKRGGGTMIAADNSKVTLEKLPVEIPNNLEVSWGLVKPKQGPKKDIIAVSFYYPPKSRKKTKMNDHIIETIHTLLAKYPNAEIVIGGDRNEFLL